MNTGIWIILGILLLPAFFAVMRYLFKREKQEDIPEAKEDGHFQRYPGAVIEYYRYQDDIHRVLHSSQRINGHELLNFKYKEIYGRRKTVLYKIPLATDSEKVHDFYLRQFEESGFKVIYSVFGRKNMGPPRQWFNKLYINGKERVNWLDLSLIMAGDIHCYISGKKINGQSEVWASLFSVNHYRNNKKTGVFIFVTENKKPVEAIKL